MKIAITYKNGKKHNFVIEDVFYHDNPSQHLGWLLYNKVSLDCLHYGWSTREHLGFGNFNIIKSSGQKELQDYCKSENVDFIFNHLGADWEVHVLDKRDRKYKKMVRLGKVTLGYPDNFNNI